jgi:signal peptidase II
MSESPEPAIAPSTEPTEASTEPAEPAVSPPAAELPPPPDPAPASAPPVAAPAADLALESARPSFVFFGVVAALSLLADVASKAWAEIVLSKRTMIDPSIVIVKDHLSFTLAYNKGGAWGLLQTASETVRKPFFLIVSVLAIAFIVSLYNRLAPGQRALKWGLPMVLGGALGNLSDRVTRSSVIDFIDYRADWIEKMNAFVARWAKSWSVTDHWPTFNVADIFICIGVGLMAVDMVTSRRKPKAPTPELAEPAKPPEPPPSVQPPEAPAPEPPVSPAA